MVRLSYYRLALILLVIELPILLWLTIEWSRLHGFFGGILFWLRQGALDPILLAAEIDFLVLLALVGLLELHDYFNRGGKVGVFFLLWCILYLVFPSLGLLVYLLFLRPKTPQPNV